MKKQARLLNRLEALGHQIFYFTLRCFGLQVAYFLLYFVVGWYVLASGKIHRNCSYYLARRFANHNRLQRFFDCYKIVISFGEVLVQRAWLGVCPRARLTRQLVHYDVFQQAVEQGKGVVLVMAHVGCWQSVFSQLDTLPVPVNVMMEFDDGAAAKHSFQLGRKKREFTLIDVKAPFGGMLSAAAALRRGEVVLIMGDRYVGGPATTASFLGRSLQLPTSAYLLAAQAGAPVVVLFAAKIGKRAFQVKIWDSFIPSYKGRDCREEMVQECVKRYLTSLEDYVEVYPYQWYNFYNFWEQ